MENINNVPTDAPDNTSAQAVSLNRTSSLDVSKDMSQKEVYITHVSNFDLGTYMIILSSTLGIIACLFANIPIIGSYGTTPAILGAILGVASILICWRNKTQMLVSIVTMFISVWAIQASVTNIDRTQESIVKFSYNVVDGVGDVVDKTVDKVIDTIVQKIFNSKVGGGMKAVNEALDWVEKMLK